MRVVWFSSLKYLTSETLKKEPASVPCIFSDQQGRGRTTLGMVIACLIKEMQITSELRSAGQLQQEKLSIIQFFLFSEKWSRLT